jgi:putative hydrolase of the HAD superfamily
MIKVIIFDFGGVLINLNRQAAVDKLVALGVHDADSLLNNYVQSGLFLDLESGAVTPAEFRNKLRTDYALQHITDEQINEAFLAFLLDVPEHKLQLLRQLKSSAHNADGEPVRIVMLSNTNGIHFPYCIKKHFEYDGYKMSDYFDALYLSYEMKASKPDEEIFLKLLEAERVRPEECFFLDDGPRNIDTAKRLGFQTHLVESSDDLWQIIENHGINY